MHLDVGGSGACTESAVLVLNEQFTDQRLAKTVEMLVCLALVALALCLLTLKFAGRQRDQGKGCLL